ncbi:MAG TPA: GNAT family N-acetyltransferase [Kaistia sp.]|nr:GNAT family N-acetyltransferase [Kaistia sp.]
MTQIQTPPAETIGFGRLDLGIARVRSEFIAITQDYFDWMNGEIIRFCALSIPEIVGMSLEAYVLHTTEIACRIAPEDGGIYAHRDGEGRIAAMGGLRRLPDGAAEIVRIFTRPDCRGRGLGSRSVDHLVGEARLLGYKILRLDTAVFMKSAQKIYRAAGFAPRDPYAGAEPPPPLLPFWLFMERSL